MNNESKPLLRLTSSTLKIIAMIFMLIAHISVIILMPMQEIYHTSLLRNIIIIFNVLGRISLPIFCFLIVEGIALTSNCFKYLLRLGISAIVLALIIFIVEIYYPGQFPIEGNIFLTLFLGAFFCGCFCYDKKHDFTGFVPLAIIILFILLSRLVPNFPVALTPEYSSYGIFMIILMFFSKVIANNYATKTAARLQIETSEFMNTEDFQRLSNLVAIITIVVVNSIYWGINLFIDNLIPIDISFQFYSILSGIFIYFYNGQVGYHKPWFKYLCYLFYPLHIVLLYGLYLLFL